LPALQMTTLGYSDIRRWHDEKPPANMRDIQTMYDKNLSSSYIQ
jgi:hypothetical protein